MGKSLRAWWMTWLVCAVMLTGCKHSTERFGAGTKTYEVKGVVVGMDPSHGELTLKHEAIPGFMDAMTMSYKLMFGEELSELHVGDIIRARLVVQKTAAGDYSNAHLDEIAVLSQSRQNFRPTNVYNVPTLGQTVPDFFLLNQYGKAIHLSQFQGKALLITFIYTRCPMGDFCPRMTRNFAAIENSLRADQGVLARTQLLSISFDPQFDTPAVLQSYGSTYVGNGGFEHWQFAAASTRSLPAMEHYFNVGVTGSDQTLTHSLSTVLIDSSGKIAAWYPGSEWQPDEVVKKIRSLIQPVLPQAKSKTEQVLQSNRS